MKNKILILAIIIILVAMAAMVIIIQKQDDDLVYGSMMDEIKEADSIAWISPDNDDEMLAGGVLALASLGYNKDVYVVTQDAQAIAIYPATDNSVRLQDNQDVKDYLELKDYIYASSFWNKDALKNFVKEKGVDIIFTFENTNGFGNPGHVQASKALTAFAKENNIKLYYLINRDPAVRYTYQGKLADLDPLPITDTLNLDNNFVVKNGKNMSLWDVKLELVKIYSSSQPNAYSIIVTNPERINQLMHFENYRKVNI